MLVRLNLVFEVLLNFKDCLPAAGPDAVERCARHGARADDAAGRAQGLAAERTRVRENVFFLISFIFSVFRRVLNHGFQKRGSS